MKKLLTLFTLLLLVCSGAWAYDGASGDVSFIKINGGGKANKMATGCYYYRPSSGYNWSDGNGVKTQDNTSSVIFYIDETTDVTVDIKHTESKNAHTVTASVYSLTESVYSAFSSITSESAVTFTLPTSVSTSFNIDIADSKETFTGTKQLSAGYYAIVCTGDSNDKGKAFFNAIHFASADSRPAAPISWSADSKSATLGDTNTYPTLTNTNDLTVSYSSSNTGVATINASTGAITLVAKGSTTISATYTATGSSEYKTTRVSYTLNVTTLKAYSNNTFNFSDSDWNGVFTTSASSSTITSHYMEFLYGLKYQDLASSTEKDGLTFTREINTGGTSDATKRLIHLLVAPKSKVTIYARPNGDNRAVTISNGSYNSSDKKSLSMSSASEVYAVSHTYDAGGDVYIYGGASINFLALKIEPMKCGTPTFSPNGGSIEEGGNVTITSTDAATIKYAWTADNVDTPDSWTSADATDDDIIVTVPDAADNTPRLHAYGIKSGYTDGDAAYVDFTITGVDTTAPTLTAQSVDDEDTNVEVAGNITLTFDENVAVADASKVTLTGGAATISSVTAENNVVTIAYTGLANNTIYTLSIASGAITDVAAAHNAYAGTSFSFTTVKEQMPAPKINGLGYFIGSQTVSITSDVDGATITYSLDGENYSAYTEPFEITDSKTVYAKATHTNYSGEGSAQLAMYIISVPASQVDVTTSTTWDFTDEDDMKPSSEVTNNPIPTTELASTVSIYTSKDKDKAAQISFIMPQRYDAGGYVQAHGFIINTTIPGTLEIKYLGGKNGNTRWLTVNGVGQSSNNSTGSSKTTSNIVIPAGTTIVYGFDVTSNPNAVNNLRYQTITFTAVTSVSGTITEAGWNTFSSNYALDLSKISGGKAYVATATDGGNVTMTPVEDKIVAAGTGLMINGTTGATFTINTTSEAADYKGGNLLVGLPNGGTVAVAGEGFNYVFGWTVPAEPGFYLIDGDTPTLGANKAYLHTTTALAGGKLNIIIDDSTSQEEETDGIKAVTTAVENGVRYNLAGQKVGADYKGIVIVNGKKMLNK